jgi:hypothetical protein
MRNIYTVIGQFVFYAFSILCRCTKNPRQIHYLCSTQWHAMPAPVSYLGIYDAGIELRRSRPAACCIECTYVTKNSLTFTTKNVLIFTYMKT